MRKKVEKRYRIELVSHGETSITLLFFDNRRFVGKIHSSVYENTQHFGIHAPNTASSLAFFRKYGLTIGQTLMLKALDWGVKKGATHLRKLFVETEEQMARRLLSPGERAFNRAVELGIVSKEGKILKVPEMPFTIKEKRLSRKEVLKRKRQTRHFFTLGEEVTATGRPKKNPHKPPR